MNLDLEKGSFAAFFALVVALVVTTYLLNRDRPQPIQEIIVYQDGPMNNTPYWVPKIVNPGCSIDPYDERPCPHRHSYIGNGVKYKVTER